MTKLFLTEMYFSGDKWVYHDLWQKDSDKIILSLFHRVFVFKMFSNARIDFSSDKYYSAIYFLTSDKYCSIVPLFNICIGKSFLSLSLLYICVCAHACVCHIHDRWSSMITYFMYILFVGLDTLYIKRYIRGSNYTRV